MPTRPVLLRFARTLYRTVLCAALPTLASAGCDRVKAGLDRDAAVEPVDMIWQSDSAFLAKHPPVLFRLYADSLGTRVAPIATFDSAGFRPIVLGPRGWRAFDVAYLHGDKTLIAVHDGRAAGTVRLTRGMWESGGQLDSIPGCTRLVPAGLGAAPPSMTLAVSSAPGALTPTGTLSEGEVQQALATVPTLIAPAQGIPLGTLQRYVRRVSVVPTGATSRPTILATYTDTATVPDSVRRTLDRPVQLIIVLDRGRYGYRPSFSFTTSGLPNAEPPLTWLDAIDTDGDGRAELLFSFPFAKVFIGTVALRFEGEAWSESFRQVLRCQG